MESLQVSRAYSLPVINCAVCMGNQRGQRSAYRSRQCRIRVGIVLVRRCFLLVGWKRRPGLVAKGGEKVAEKVVCNQCGAEYTDTESIEQTKKWAADGYAPCPNLDCPGELEVKQD